MWDKWREKIRNFIWKEVEVTEEDQDNDFSQHPSQIQHIDTKMVYKYPKQKSFQFPVIPDEKSHGKQNNLEIPAYKRRHADTKHETNESSEHKKTKQEIESTSINDSPKVNPKKDSKPFKPSRVASPIYGYQERKESKKIQEIPAFMRKQTEQEKETEYASEVLKEQLSEHADDIDEKINQKHQEERESEIDREHQEYQDYQEPQDYQEKYAIQAQDEAQSLEEQHVSNMTSSREVAKRAQEDSQALDHSQRHQTEPEQEQPITPAQKPVVEEKKTSSSKKKTKGERERESVPFNVIMTPRDKKNLFDKQRAEANKQAAQKAEEPAATIEEDVSIPYHLLDEPEKDNHTNDVWVEEQKGLLEQTLKHFNVKATVVNATQGPSVTRFEVKPELGVKVSRIRNLSDDLKLNMAAKDIRIEAPIPGKNTVGIEVPNLEAQKVGLQEIFDTDAFNRSESSLSIALGLNIEGSPIVTNIQKMPHGLIAGATGSGKSVCINTILISLLYKASPEEVKLLLIDPKMVELAQYNGIPHLVSPVITDVKAANAALKWAVNEMEERYEKFVKESVRNIEKYNEKMLNMDMQDEKMPFIVIVIDELADLMMVAPQDVEDSISRIAQKARACGIHLLVATQRPSVDVITGLIKANIPTRIAFSVSSQVDSRTIIDTGGAEKLLGKGDMLFVENGAGQSIRLQGAFVSDEEVSRVTAHARKMGAPNYLFEQESLLEEMTMIEEEDELLQAAIDFVIDQNSASTSMLQRHFKIGYNRAARLIDTLEQKGIITGQNGSKPRDVLVTKQQIEEINER